VDQTFPSAGALLEFATYHWRDHFVTEDLVTQEVIVAFSKRPFFLLISVEAPISTRFLRRKAVQPELDLESFIEEHDFLTWTAGPSTPQTNNPITSLNDLRSFVNVTIVNDVPSVEHLWQHLSELDLLNSERLRPSWDSYFMSLASLAAMRSNCMKRRVGAILVNNKRVISTGYNGTPRGLTNCNEGGCARCNGGAKSGQALDECLCLHAEENALLEACRGRTGEDSAVIYCNTCPCLRCSVKIVQWGVREVVYNLTYSMDAASARVLSEGGVLLRQYVPLP